MFICISVLWVVIAKVIFLWGYICSGFNWGLMVKSGGGKFV